MPGGGNEYSDTIKVDNTVGAGKLSCAIVHLQLVKSSDSGSFIASGSYVDKRNSGFIF